MLHSFTIQNFKSILDLTVDFTYNEGKAPNNYQDMETIPFLQVKDKIRLVPCIAMYGTNASGKSNIVEALYALRHIIFNGIYDNYKPNKLNKKYDATKFTLSVYINKSLYEYTIQYNDTKIIEETLEVNNQTLFSISNKNISKADKITTKQYDTKKLQEIYKVECCNENEEQQKTFLKIISKNYAGLNKNIPEFAKYIAKHIMIIHDTQLPIGLGIKTLQDFYKENKQKAFEDIVNILKKFDFDIIRMKFEEKSMDEDKEAFKRNRKYGNSELFVRDNKLYRNKITSYHKNTNDEDVEFDFHEDESLGTQTLAGIIGHILFALYTGSVLCIDELERSIHPLVLREVVKMFKDKRYNTNNAQLLFTAHNTDILDDEILRISEIAFISKTLKSGTVFRKVSSYEGIRNTTNFRKQYLDGVFSAIPHPYI